ncbi:MAG: hypothetical protein ACXVJT_14235 [Thermoanaerobaculia bacterium]
MNVKKILLAIAVILELLSVGLFLTGAQTAVAASLLAIGLSLVVVAVNGDRKRRRS